MTQEQHAPMMADSGKGDGLPDQPSEVLYRMQNMDDFQFEHLVADLWELQGWETAVSQQSVDAGIDVTATKHFPYDEKALIQAKRYGGDTTVGSRDIQQYNSLKQQEPGVDKVVIVTTGGFSKPAETLGGKLNVKLIDGADLMDLVYSLECGDLMGEYGLLPESEPPAEERSYENAEEHEADPEDVFLHALIGLFVFNVVGILGLLALGAPLVPMIAIGVFVSLLAVAGYFVDRYDL